MKNKTKKLAKKLVKALHDEWNKEYEEAGAPMHYCPNESLYWAIREIETQLRKIGIET